MIGSNRAGRLPRLSPMTREITMPCVRCRIREVTISEIAWLTTVKGRGFPCPANTCKECRTYPPGVRVRWQQMDHDPLQGVYE